MSTHDKIVVAVRVRPFSNREIKLTAGSKRPGVSDIETDIILYIPFHHNAIALPSLESRLAINIGSISRRTRRRVFMEQPFSFCCT